MNYTMGRYIDELDDEGRDRLISAPEFNDGFRWWDGDGCGCLHGTACGPAVDVMGTAEWVRYWDTPEGTSRFAGAIGDSIVAMSWSRAPASVRYAYAVARFGKARVVRAIKARAARRNREAIDFMLAPTETGSEVEVGI